MMTVYSVVGLASQCLFWAWLMQPARQQLRTSWLRVFPLLPLPVLAWFSLGWFGPLSPVACCWLLGNWRAPRTRLPLPLLLLGFFGGLLLYASALGYISTDVYGAGYQPHWLLLPILAGAVLLAYWNKIIGWGCVLALLLFAGRALESHNIWDYLLDPLLWLVMAGQLVQAVVRKVKPKAVVSV